MRIAIIACVLVASVTVLIVVGVLQRALTESRRTLSNVGNACATALVAATRSLRIVSFCSYGRSQDTCARLWNSVAKSWRAPPSALG